MAIQFKSSADANITHVDIRAEYNAPAESVAAETSVKGYARDVLGIKADNVEIHRVNSGRTKAGKFFSDFRADILG